MSPIKDITSNVYSSQRDPQLARLLHSGFLLVGLVQTMLGPMLAMLAARWRLTDAEAGFLFIAQFTGAMIGSALSSPMIGWIGAVRLMRLQLRDDGRGRRLSGH